MKKSHIIPSFKLDWQSQPWKTQLSHGISSVEQLLKTLNLSTKQLSIQKDASQLFKTRVPWSFVSRMKSGDPEDPLLLQVLAQDDEFKQVNGFSKNPLQEHPASKSLLHKYHNRVLLILSGACAINCRYCFRRHFPYQDYLPGKSGIQEIVDYLLKHPQVNELILSGGDPLVMDDEYLHRLFCQISPIKTLKRLRIHSRIPIVLPARITKRFVDNFSQLPLQTILVTHANHANEINAEVMEGLVNLKQAGVTLLNQSVLLKGINDSVSALAELSEILFQAHVMPYYLHQLDKVEGAAHFSVTNQQARALMKELLEILPGFLVPKLVKEIPGAASKWPVDLRITL